MLKFVSVVCVAAFAAAPLAAQTSSTPESKPALDPNRRICQKVEQTGSRVRTTKICKKASEWEAQQERAREKRERAQQNSDDANNG